MNGTLVEHINKANDSREKFRVLNQRNKKILEMQIKKKIKRSNTFALS